LDTRPKASTKAIAELVEKSESTLTETVGITQVLPGQLEPLGQDRA